jgi:Family of unknown function (DUF6281)
MARALAAVAIAGLVLGVGGAAGKPAGPQRCLFSIVYDGSVYHYVSSENVKPGRRVGRAVRQGCNDTGGPPPPARPVEAFRFGSANARVALVVREDRQPNLIVAVPGRCFGLPSGRSYLRCLQTEIRFRGRGYTAVRGVPLPAAGPLGPGTTHGRPVRLRGLRGIDPRIALLRDGTRELLVAHRRCELMPGKDFVRCLRAPLWLSIEGETAIRTATIERPGSLLRNVQLPLYLAPDEVADEIVSSQDERLTRTGHLAVDGRGRGSARIAIVDSIDAGSYAVMAELPSRRMVPVGALYLAPRRD